MHQSSNSFAIIEAPSILGLKPTGVEHLPKALLNNGLADRLHARLAEKLDTPSYDPNCDAETLTLNARAIAQWSPRLANAVKRVLDAGEFPLILGGDCSILLGSMLAFRRRGRYGLLFIDGHADFYQPEANPEGEAASMDLALATGYGSDLLTNIEGLKPLVRPEDVVVFGFRDAEEQQEYESQPLPDEMKSFDLGQVRSLGIAAAAEEAVSHLERSDLDGFFIHLDADSLSDDVMPAVDYRLPDGLTVDELVTVLDRAIKSSKSAGLEVTIYNPRLDKTGEAGKALTDALVKGIAS
jgi:arginase